MTDHAWAADNIAAYVAGGLDAAEAERLDAHARDCPACAAALADARKLDRGLESLFAAVRPGPALEDRAIQNLRAARTRRMVLAGWQKKLTIGVAASVGLGLSGAAVTSSLNLDRLPFPGEPLPSFAEAARIKREAYDDLKAGVAAVSRTPPPGEGLLKDYGLQKEVLSKLHDPSTMARDLAEQNRGRFGTAAGGEGRMQFGLTLPDAGLDTELKAAIEVDRVEDLTTGRTVSGADSANSRFRAPLRVREVPMEGAQAPGGPGGPPGGYPPGYGGMGGPGAPGGGGPGGAAPMYGYIVPLPTTNGTQPAKPDDAYFKPNTFYLQLGQKPGGDKDNREGRPEGELAKPKPEARDPDPQKADKPGRSAPDPNTAPAPATARKVIRSGDIEFEVESFDPAVATVTKLVAGIPGAFVATVNSDKLPNGKVKGSVVVRVPPDSLDSLLLDLRKELGKVGELKGLRVGSQDITKQYTDLESRLKAARTMEQRLLEIIKSGKGEIKQLLEAEKELGVWRTRIEEFEGELRYYANLVAHSTLTIALAEKEIKSAAGLTESERVQAGVEVEDVDQAYRQALAAVTEAKGRVTKSELKQLAAGQFNATLHFEVPPDAGGPVRDRLRQLGRVARLEIDRVQQAEGGTPAKDVKVKRGDTQFQVQLYNLANIQPRETATLQVAVPDVPAGYQALRDAVSRANGRVLVANLNEQDRQNVTGQLDFEVRRAEEGAIQAALAAAGEVVSRVVTRAPEGDNVTDAKVLHRVTLFGTARVRPRETVVLASEVADVEATVAVFGAHVAEVKGRVVDTQISRERSGRVTARLIYDVPLAAAAGVVAKFKEAGEPRVHQSAQDKQAPDGKYAIARIDVTLSNTELIVPKDDGLVPQVRKGLSYSVSVLLVSVMWLVVGLCVVLPWAVVGYGGYRVVRRLSRPAAAPTPTPTPTSAAA